MLPNADWFEWVYTVLIVAGLLLAISNGHYATRNWQKHRRKPLADPLEQQEETVVGVQVLINRWGLVGVQVCLLVLAARALSLPTNQAITPRDWTAYISGIAILAASVTIDVMAVTQFYSNYRFDRIGKQGAPKP
jgi:hypothetical protein